MVYRNVGEFDPKIILDKLSGWDIFPHTPEGAEAAVSVMSGEDKKRDGLKVSWEGDRIGIIAGANTETWGAVPEGVTPLTMYFTVFLSDDIDSGIYYSVLVDKGELIDVVMSDEGEIIGNIYSQNVSDSDEFEGEQEDDIKHSLAIITDNGMIGRAYFAYSPESPVADKIVRLYTSALEVIARQLSTQPEFHAAISDFESAQSVRAALEIILVNDAEQAKALSWYKPLRGLTGWKSFLPYTEDGFTNGIYQLVTGHPIDVVESMLYKINSNKLPWLGKSMRFLARPDSKDIRMSSYSPLLVNIEPVASRVLPLIKDEPTDEARTVNIGGIEVLVRYGVEKQPAFHNGKESEIFSFRAVATAPELDLMITFDYISHNQTDAYAKDIDAIIGNLVISLQGVHI